MWPSTAAQLAEILDAELVGTPQARVEGISTDSRAGIRSTDVFLGLPGLHFDGGRFATSALRQGAAVAIVAHETPVRSAPGKAILYVSNPLAALQTLAAEARQRFKGIVVAITGSNGKTTVKGMMRQALAPSHRLYASPRSYNSQVGVALSLLRIDPEAAIALIECGISLPGEMELLERMVRPDCGILTSIGDAHQEGLGNRRVTAQEKASLFRNLKRQRAEHGPKHETGQGGWVLTPAEETLAIEALRSLGATVISVGAKESLFRCQFDSIPPSLRWHDERIPLTLPLASTFLLTDAALAAAGALLLGGDSSAIGEGLAAWTPAPMRLEMSRTPRGILLINDAYTADPTSVEAALQVLHNEDTGGASIAVLAGMAQLGSARIEAHERVGQRVVELNIDHLIGVGEGGREIVEAARVAGLPMARTHLAANTSQASWVLEELCRPGDRVLLKGSRPEGLERIAANLFEALAPARLYVDLDAVVANYRAIQKHVGPGTGVMAVVKSFGYGIDAVRIARSLETAGIDYLAVAYADEGVELRDNGITLPVLVQNILATESEKIVRYGLTAQVSSADQIDGLELEARAQQMPVRLHLKIDTGMGRAGTTLEEVEALLSNVRASSWLSLEGLMTHFAAADDPAQDDFTRAQIAHFENARVALRRAGEQPRWEHAANSAALIRFPEAHYSLVRAGLSLLGYCQIPGADILPQLPALRFVTQVIAVKTIPAGGAVGYGRTFRAGDHPLKVALVAIGYNDGYPWALSNRGWMRLGDQRCPVVGRVSMDVTQIDVSRLDREPRPGDEVTVFGPDEKDPSLLDLARLAGTIPYEMLTRISSRVRRIFRSSS